ncbi:MAG: acyl-CoA dehydrogenase family protein [Rhodovarius sp.]|nr:acyl-CoA dehydrogenase family protein [Rhodovarius sp.]MDW8314045.1 acyl-CoA dehydrogenase family protein [Rhodovarius sp.]
MSRTPAEDIAFALTRLIPLPQREPGLDAATVAAILTEAERFAAEVLAPHAQEADRIGARLENGRVRTPYAAPYAAWRAGGWQSLPAPPEHGGQGLPFALWCGVLELCSAADMAFMLCPLLTAGAIEAIARHASPDQRARWLPPLIAAEWTGTMCLTEPQAGSDLSDLRTRAEPLGDGRYALHGQKIYITYGDHDLTENCLHLVLARLPDAPAGTRGISLFAAPRLLPDGRANALRAAGLERKLGIHASPTCVMLFEGAVAELIGEPHRGLSAMFAMMNNARLAVGIQGVGQGARALALAEAYAAQRIQGGRPIARHPDVARMLAEMRAITTAMRFLALEAAASPPVRLALLTPIVKAWCTDRGVEVAHLGLQVHGGLGYIEDAGAAQVLRDARIAPIYEGTNGIQALDLVQRKLRGDGGVAMLSLLEQEVAPTDPLLAAAAARLAEAARWLLTAPAEEAAAGATPFLEAAGWVLGGWMLARAAALDAAYAPMAAFYLRRLLPRADAALIQVKEAEVLLAWMAS